MKTIKFLVGSFCAIFLISCSSEDDSIDSDPSMLLGTWNMQTYEYSMDATLAAGGEDFTFVYLGEAEDVNATLTFNDDRTFNFQGSYKVIVDFEGMITEYEYSNAESTGDYNIRGNKLTVSNTLGKLEGMEVPTTGGGEMEIAEVTANKLVLRGDQKVDMTQGGINYEVEVSEYYLFTR